LKDKGLKGNHKEYKGINLETASPDSYGEMG
jgi:hypothetical protein